MIVELLTVGDELLRGDIPNGNAAWLGRTLTEAGIEVGRSSVVADELDVIGAAVTEALRRAPILVVTGGLGPTSDDVTRDALARAAGVGLHRDPATVARLTERAVARGAELPEMTLRMAEVPDGAVTLPNPVGGAPGLRIEMAGGTVYVLPGVPAEMRAIFSETVLPELVSNDSDGAGRRVTSALVLRTVGVDESQIATRLAPIERMAGIELGYYPHPAQTQVRITVSGPDAAERIHPVEERVRALLGTSVYGSGADTLDQVVHRLLAERGATVAVAESLTGGLIGAELTAMPGSSATFVGGVIAYATGQKASLLGVPEDLLAEHGAVHPEVAAAMAAGVRDRMGASYGVAVTGVAGPEPQDGRPVGTVHLAVADGRSRPVVSSRHFLPASRRELIRRLTVVHALDLLRCALLGIDQVTRWDD
jgi:competence/damage-inducible protein CinA-like protein